MGQKHYIVYQGSITVNARYYYLSN